MKHLFLFKNSFLVNNATLHTTFDMQKHITFDITFKIYHTAVISDSILVVILNKYY